MDAPFSPNPTFLPSKANLHRVRWGAGAGLLFGLVGAMWWEKEMPPSSKNVLKCCTDSAAGWYRPPLFNSEFCCITDNSNRTCLLVNGDVEVFPWPGCFGVRPLRKRWRGPTQRGLRALRRSESGDFRGKRD